MSDCGGGGDLMADVWHTKMIGPGPHKFTPRINANLARSNVIRQWSEQWSEPDMPSVLTCAGTDL